MQTPLKNMFLPYTPLGSTRLHVLLAAQLGLALLLWLGADSKMLPGPPAVAGAWWELVHSHGLLRELWHSATLLLLALSLAAGLALVIVFLATAPFFLPLAQFSSTLRFIGLAGLSFIFMLITQDGTQLKLALLVFGITVMLVTALLAEVRALPGTQIEHCQTLGLRHWRISWELVVLGKADVFLDLVRQNAAVGWTLLTMVEGLQRAEGGIGAMLLNQNRYFQLAAVFAIQITILAYGVLQDWGFTWLRATLCPHTQVQQSNLGV